MPKLKHNQSVRGQVSPEYRAWIEMRRRAGAPQSRPNARAYASVEVCEQWRNSFEAFFADIGPRPSVAHSLDRYPDPSGHYEPGNVRWATVVEQNRNKRTNRLIVINGVTRCLTEWAQLSGLSVATVYRRLKVGWPIERLLDPPLKDTSHSSPLRNARLTKISAQNLT